MPDSSTALILILFAGYFLPWFIALARSHRQVAPIFIVNLFLGWTLIGWVATLAWACSSSGFAEPIVKSNIVEPESSWKRDIARDIARDAAEQQRRRNEL